MKKKSISRSGAPVPVTKKKGTVSVTGRLKHLDRTQRHAVLATVSGTAPHTSLVAFVLTKDRKGIVFATPTATAKYRNMKRNSRVSLLIDSRENSGKDYLGAEAVTVFGTAREIPEGSKWAELAMLLVSKHPALERFVAAPTTAVMLVTISRCVHVGRFQTITAGRPA